MLKTQMYLLYDVNEVFEHVSFPLVCDYSGRQVAQNMRRHRLDGIQVSTNQQNVVFVHKCNNYD